MIARTAAVMCAGLEARPAGIRPVEKAWPPLIVGFNIQDVLCSIMQAIAAFANSAADQLAQKQAQPDHPEGDPDSENGHGVNFSSEETDRM